MNEIDAAGVFIFVVICYVLLFINTRFLSKDIIKLQQRIEDLENKNIELNSMIDSLLKNKREV